MLRRSQSNYTLGEAAQRALDTARDEKLALAHVAEEAGEPQFWFALNILSLVNVEGRSADDARSERLDRSTFDAFVLDAGMTRLCARGAGRDDVTGLSVSRGEFDKYMRWARTVR